MGRHVFGPVPSRRLGRSLGVDPVPFKTCNWNCVYCQLGFTRKLVHERREFFPPEEAVAEVRSALEAKNGGGVDWISFVGSGETTLHAGLGRMIRDVKAMTAIPVAVLTNGSLLYRKDVRDDLRHADAVLPTVDAGTEDLYLRLNRPHKEATFDRLIDGLVAFRRVYKGQLWVEVMLVKGVNDTPDALRDLAAVLRRVRPDAVHLNLPTRPPAEPWVEPSGEEGLVRAEYFLGDIAAPVPETTVPLEVWRNGDPVGELVEVIERHPLAEEDLWRLLEERAPERSAEILDRLGRDPRVRLVARYGRRFWCYAQGRYVTVQHG